MLMEEFMQELKAFYVWFLDFISHGQTLLWIELTARELCLNRCFLLSYACSVLDASLEAELDKEHRKLLGYLMTKIIAISDLSISN